MADRRRGDRSHHVGPTARVVRAVVLLVTVLLGAGVFLAGPAAAHAALVSTDPADGASLTTEPSDVTLEFNENVGNAAVAVTAPDGSTTTVSQVRAVDRRVTAQVAASGQRGTYTLAYRVVSADGHPVEGTVAYDVSTGREVEQQAVVSDDESFVHRHREHLLWALGAVVVALALLFVPLRDREST